MARTAREWRVTRTLTAVIRAESAVGAAEEAEKMYLRGGEMQTVEVKVTLD